MFTKCINDTPFTSPAADSVFQDTIWVSDRVEDATFTSTIRALLGKRIAPDSAFSFRYFVESSAYSSVAYIQGAIQKGIGSLLDVEETLRILSIQNCDFDVFGEKEAKAMEEANDGWVYVQKITEFFRKTFPVYVFIHPECKNAAVTIGRCDIKRWHFLQCAIPAMLPWYFDNQELSPDEMELIKSLHEKSPDKYLSVLDTLAKQYDIRSMYINKKLSGFESKVFRARRKELETSNGHIRDKINDYNANIRACFERLMENNERITGLNHLIDTAKDELAQYFLANSHLVLESVTDNDITYGVKDYLSYWDEDIARRVIENPRTDLYSNATAQFTREDAQSLMKAIFIDQVFRVKICALFTLNPGSGLAGISLATYSKDYAGYLPNPHIHHYSCLGNYDSIIHDMLMEGCDTTSIIEQSAASAKSINFGDYSVMYQFFTDMFRREFDSPFIELPDGTSATPANAIAYIKNNLNEEENSHE